jgi:hypothetical protein
VQDSQRRDFLELYVWAALAGWRDVLHLVWLEERLVMDRAMENNEQWRDAIGFPTYEVSSYGRVRRCVNGKMRLLKAAAPSTRYPAVHLSRSGFPNGCVQYIHVLVAEAFIGPRPDGLVINHKNGIKADNNVENLEYVSYAENNAHALQIGLNSRERISEGVRRAFASGRYDTQEMARKSAETRKKTGIAREAQYKAWVTRRKRAAQKGNE